MGKAPRVDEHSFNTGRGADGLYVFGEGVMGNIDARVVVDREEVAVAAGKPHDFFIPPAEAAAFDADED